MSENADAGAGFLLFLLFMGARIGIWIYSGTTAWDWIEPNSFGGAVQFVIVWSILGAIFEFVLGGILLAIGNSVNQ
jgi:hypothetical protein